MKMSELKNLIRETLAEMEGTETDHEERLELLGRDYSDALEDLRDSVDELFSSVDSDVSLYPGEDPFESTLSLINKREEILDDIEKKVKMVRSAGYVYASNYVKAVRR